MSDYGKLDVERSTSAIMQAARNGQFLSYSDVAKANGLEWSFALNRNINKHLDEVLKKADGAGLPLITAIVVNKPNLKTGRLKGRALKGFIDCALRLDYEVDDPSSFLADQQRETFAIARTYEAGQ